MLKCKILDRKLLVKAQDGKAESDPRIKIVSFFQHNISPIDAIQF